MSIFGWVSDCCLTPIQQFLAASWREQVNFQWDDDEVCFVINQHALNELLDFYSASSLKQKQQSAGRHVAPLRHIILIPRQPVFQNLFFHLNAVCFIAEKQQKQ